LRRPNNAPDCQRSSRMKPDQNPDFHPTNGREGETSTLLFGLSVTLTLRGGGFAPRHLSRYVCCRVVCRRINKDECIRKRFGRISGTLLQFDQKKLLAEASNFKMQIQGESATGLTAGFAIFCHLFKPRYG